MSINEAQPLVQMAATIVGINGGLLALYKYFSDKRDKEIREWQKVVIYKIFRQNETQALTFTNVLEKYRIDAQAFEDVGLKKKEVSENALRRVMLELVSSNILSLEPSDAFRLRVVRAEPDSAALFAGITQELARAGIMDRINPELARMVGANPNLYTLDEVVKEIAPKVGVDIPILRNNLKMSIQASLLIMDEKGRLAFPQ